jgi:hypothetical protein
MLANTTSLNLDREAALAAQRVQQDCDVARASDPAEGDPETLDRVATKALGVLHEQGVYACMLFLFSRGKAEQKYAGWIGQHLLAVAAGLPFGEEWAQLAQRSNTVAETLQRVSDTVSADMSKLLLVRDLFEQTLIYIRYGAKACAREAEAARNAAGAEGAAPGGGGGEAGSSPADTAGHPRQ